MEVAASEGLIPNPSDGGVVLAGSSSARAWLFARYESRPGLFHALCSSSESNRQSSTFLSTEIVSARLSRIRIRGGFGAASEAPRGSSGNRMLRCRAAKKRCLPRTSGGRVVGEDWGSVGGWSLPDRTEPPLVGGGLSAGAQTLRPIGSSPCKRRSFRRSSLQPTRVLRAHHGLRSRVPG